MHKIILALFIIGLLAFGSTAIAVDTNYLLAKKDKAKKEKIHKKQKKGPNQNAIDHANPNAKFKRYDDYTPKEKKKLEGKRWGEMDKEEQDAISEKYKKNKEKLEEVKRNAKRWGEILKSD